MNMTYLSTRGGGEPVSSARAISRGLAPDGGLYVPSAFPRVSAAMLRELMPLPYARRAARILSLFLRDFAPETLAAMCEAAYARFEDARPAPVAKAGDAYYLELYHGPTLAFKDVALTLLAQLLPEAARKCGETRELLVAVATSGDTGKAALSAFMDVPGTRCAVFYPEGGVSEAQRLQMVTQRGRNTHVIAVRGNFDDAQTGVKRIFAQDEAAFDHLGFALTSANSINFGRLVPQVAYYFSAYLDLVSAGVCEMGDEVNFCVPTGNFGNILAAEYAREMGLPVGKLLCASNRNHVLTDFIRTGVYDARRDFSLTQSPSMDILISSNLERMLFELTGRDASQVSGFMRSLSENGRYEIPALAKDALDARFWGGWTDEAATREEILRVWSEHKYLIDPHTAVASRALLDYREETGDPRPCVIAATASPFKFGRAVAAALLPEASGNDFALCEAIAEYTGIPVPQAIAELPSLPVRHTAVCEKDAMRDALLGALQ